MTNAISTALKTEAYRLPSSYAQAARTATLQVFFGKAMPEGIFCGDFFSTLGQ